MSDGDKNLSLVLAVGLSIPVVAFFAWWVLS